MSLNMGDQEYNSGKKYRQKGTLCGPNRMAQEMVFRIRVSCRRVQWVEDTVGKPTLFDTNLIFK
jgi:hypothetical protein